MELHSELYDLAAARATRSTQVLYAVQQFRRVWVLRRALVDPQRHWFDPLLNSLCWVLRSDVRTWAVLVPLNVAALFDVVDEQGWGSAFLAVPTVVAFWAGVGWLRKRLGVEVQQRGKASDR